MDSFLYDTDLRHERVKNNFLGNTSGLLLLKVIQSFENQPPKHKQTLFTILLLRYTSYLGQLQYWESCQTSMMEFCCQQLLQKKSTINFWQDPKHQKQLSRSVHISANMQQIYRRKPMPKCDFIKIALELYWNFTSIWTFSCKFPGYLQNTVL